MGFVEPGDSREWAIGRVAKHKAYIIGANPCTDSDAMDEALRAACTTMMAQDGEVCVPPPGTDAGLRYIRDRISVPRDMPIWSARRLREALERTAALAGAEQGPPISPRSRRDQNPRDFGK